MKCASILLIAAMANTTFADILILKDGTKLKGTVEKKKDKDSGIVTYILEDVDGTFHTHTRDEVKKFIYESRLSAIQVAASFNAWADLVVPALNGEMPEQGNVRRTMGNDRYGVKPIGAGWMLYFSELGGDANREAVSSDRFTDNWAKATVPFAALRLNPKYEKLMDKRKASGSLWAFANYPPEGSKEIAETLKRALRGMENCIKIEEKTTKFASSINNKAASELAKSRRAKAHATRISQSPNDVSGSNRDRIRKSHDKARRIARSRQHAKNSEITRQENAQKATHNLDRLITEFLRKRLIVLEQIKMVNELIE